jgi:hypothetical protein
LSSPLVTFGLHPEHQQVESEADLAAFSLIFTVQGD